MSFLRQGLLNLTNLLSKKTNICQSQQPFHSLTLNPVGITTEPAAPGGLYSVFVRNVIRVHFPRPSERKRIKRHGWQKRMSTPGGRKVLMRRILKGRFYYSH